MTQVQYCARHSKTETKIRCGRCETPICPECLVHAPVGMRCPDCAKVNVVPTYDVPLPVLLRGIGAGVGVAGILALVYLFTVPAMFRLVFLGIPGLNIVLPILFTAMMAGVGYAVGEAISLATNRKRGLKLKLAGAGSILLVSIVFTYAFPSGAYGLTYLFIGLALATWLAVRPF